MYKLTSSLALALGFTLTGCAQANANPDLTYAAEKSINGVVSIKSYASVSSTYNSSPYGGTGDPLFDFFFGGGSQRRSTPQRQGGNSERQLGLGSGVILSEDGYLVTNNHVIGQADRLEVTLNDNRTFDATIVGSDPVTDLALLKIDASSLPVIPMGNSDDLRIGQWVLAVGNPFGFTSTVTAGIVSAKARSISSATNSHSMGIESYIQTDAAVNPGNSGGALVNTDGELVGINTAIYSQTGNYAGYSFAIPTSIVSKVVADLKQYGTVQRAVLGITFRELDAKIIKDEKIEGVSAGILVAEVLERSAAADAGLQPGDVIIAIGEAEVHSTAQMQEQMARMRPGDQVTIIYIRNGARQAAKATLRNNQGGVSLTRPGDFSELGCALKTLTARDLANLRLNGGVQVSGLTDGKFKDAGIREGFIITEINGQRVHSVQEVEKIYESITHSASTDEKVMFITGFYSTGRKSYYAVDLSDSEQD